MLLRLRLRRLKTKRREDAIGEAGGFHVTILSCYRPHAFSFFLTSSLHPLPMSFSPQQVMQDAESVNRKVQFSTSVENIQTSRFGQLPVWDSAVSNVVHFHAGDLIPVRRPSGISAERTACFVSLTFSFTCTHNFNVSSLSFLFDEFLICFKLSQ